LMKNHHRKDGVWLFHYKKRASTTGLRHEEAVEEALRYGWIDSKLRSFDQDRYVLKYTPRRKGSVWSEVNKKVALRMIRQGKMTRAGLEKIREARMNGMWDSAYSSRSSPAVPDDLRKALKRDGKAMANFEKLSNSHRTQYIFWVEGAKKGSTRKKRIDTVVMQLHLGRKPG